MSDWTQGAGGPLYRSPEIMPGSVLGDALAAASAKSRKLSGWKTGMLAPVDRNIVTGDLRPAVPMFIQDAIRGVMAPGKAMRGEYGLTASPDGRVSYDGMAEDAAALAGTVMTGGVPIPKPANSLGVVGGTLAKSIDMPTKLPSDPAFLEAVKGTPGASLSPDGLQLNVRRYQPTEQGGTESIRTGTFYLPAGSAQEKYYRTGKTGYGGSQKIEGETVIRNPLVVKGATGGKAPEVAYDTLMGKGAYENMRREVLRALPYGRKITEGEVGELLDRFGADSDMAWQIVEVTKKTGGNTLPYAIQENIVAHAIRNAGHDAMVGYSKGKSGPFISEIFDVREHISPTPSGATEVHPAFRVK